MAPNVAVVGVTGAVGQEFLSILEQRKFPFKTLRVLASSRSAGKTVPFKGKEYTIEELTQDSFKGIDIALFSAGASRSREFASAAVKAGAVVVDNSSAFRMDPQVPLVIPEINPQKIKEHKGIIANPNCSTIIGIVPIWPLHKINPVKRMVVSTYQAASGAGMSAMLELESQSREILAGKPPTKNVFPHQIAFNVIPHIDKFDGGGYTGEEMKLVNEVRKILELPDLPVSPTTVRVPVFRCHSEAVNIETEQKITPHEVRQLLTTAPGVVVIDEPEKSQYPMPLTVAGRDEVFIGRIREDPSHDRAINLWLVSDNLRKGAALNMVQIMELLSAENGR